MASRLHRTGSIFARIDGLLKTGVTRKTNRPMWYDIYKAFPPTYEPVLNKPLPDCKIRPIFYKEDIARAKLHQTVYKSRVWDLQGLHKDESIKIYLNKLEEGLTEEEAFNHVKEVTIATIQSNIDAKEATKNVSPIAAEEIAKDASPEAVEEIAKDASPEAVEEITKDASPEGVGEVNKNVQPETVDEVKTQTTVDNKKSIN